MITEDYVSFETAKLLKEKGFKGFTMFSYSTRGSTMCGHWENEIDWMPKCTLQMAMKWLREVHNIFIQISAVLQDQPFGLHYIPSIQDYHAYARHDNFSEYVTYEEAVEDALRYSRENLI